MRVSQKRLQTLHGFSWSHKGTLNPKPQTLKKVPYLASGFATSHLLVEEKLRHQPWRLRTVRIGVILGLYWAYIRVILGLY